MVKHRVEPKKKKNKTKTVGNNTNQNILSSAQKPQSLLPKEPWSVSPMFSTEASSLLSL